MKYSILIIVCIILVSCHAQETNISYDVQLDSINDSYFNIRTWGFYEDNTGIYFYAKDYSPDTIKVFKESNNGFDFYKNILLPKNYIDTMGKEIHSDKYKITFVNLDNIIVCTRQSIALINIKNNNLSKFYWHSLEDDNYALVDRFGILKWNAYRKKLPLMLVRFDNRNERKWGWDSELLAEFSFETGTFNIIPIKYPYVEQYTAKEINYNYVDPLITFKKDTYVVGFGNTPVMFSYDTKKNKLDSFYIKNSTYKSITILHDTLAKNDFTRYQEYATNSMIYDYFYNLLIYDEYKDVFYRFFFKDMPQYDEGVD